MKILYFLLALSLINFTTAITAREAYDLTVKSVHQQANDKIDFLERQIKYNANKGLNQVSFRLNVGSTGLAKFIAEHYRKLGFHVNTIDATGGYTLRW